MYIYNIIFNIKNITYSKVDEKINYTFVFLAILMFISSKLKSELRRNVKFNFRTCTEKQKIKTEEEGAEEREAGGRWRMVRVSFTLI